jgi:hypothetical protein
MSSGSIVLLMGKNKLGDFSQGRKKKSSLDFSDTVL